MLTKQWRQRKKQKKVGLLIQKQNNFARAEPFFVHFFAVVLRNDNLKLSETSSPSYTFYGRNVVCGTVHFFFAAALFYLDGR